MSTNEEPSSRNHHDAIDVAYVAHLARIALRPDELDTFQTQLEQILSHVNQLSELDVEGVEPTAHAVPVENVFREDVASTCIDHEEVMRNAPAQRSGQFLVPRIIE